MGLTKKQIEEIKSEKNSGTSEQLLTHLKRNYPVFEVKFDWMDKPFKQIKVDEKLKVLENNKKYLVDLIFNILESEWAHLGTSVIRRTIKKYLDGIK